MCAPTTKPRHWTEADEEEAGEDLSISIINSLSPLWCNLVIFDLSYSNINVNVIQSICECCSKLEGLNLAHCEAIDNDCMITLSQANCAPVFKAINITGCK